MSRIPHSDPLKIGAYSAVGYQPAASLLTSGRAVPSGGSGDKHTRQHRDVLVKMGADFDRSNGIYEGLVNRAVEAILGSGSTLQALTGDDARDNAIETDWAAFCESPEVTGQFTFAECEALALREVINSGDLAVLADDEQGLYQYWESEQIATVTKQGTRQVEKTVNRIEQGIEFNTFGRPVGFWLCPRDRDGMPQTAKAKRHDAKDVAFWAYRKRFSQARGIPVLTASFSNIHRLNDIADSEAIAWQLLARFAVAINRQGGPQRAFEESSAAGTTDTSPPDLADRYVETQAGTFFHGEPGEEIKAIERNLPGANFPESVRMFLRLIGLPLGLPLEIILLDFSQTNYSSARAAWSQAWASFTKWQMALKKRHNTPLYLRWLRWRIASGERPEVYRDEPAMYRHKWDLPTFPWWNPKEEADAWGAKIEHGFATQTDALASQGVDQQDYLRRRASEIEAAMKTANEINANNPDAPPVHWRELIGAPVSKNDTYTQQTTPSPAKVTA